MCSVPCQSVVTLVLRHLGSGCSEHPLPLSFFEASLPHKRRQTRLQKKVQPGLQSRDYCCPGYRAKLSFVCSLLSSTLSESAPIERRYRLTISVRRPLDTVQRDEWLCPKVTPSAARPGTVSALPGRRLVGAAAGGIPSLPWLLSLVSP